MKELRRKKHQQALGLIAVRDGDKVGVKSRKQQLDQALQSAGLPVRQPDERIATPVPARNIETWLLALLGAAEIDETEDYKPRFEKEHGAHERSALGEGAAAWKGINNTSLLSLRDGKAEMQRLDP